MRLVKDGMLPQLNFTDAMKCIDCIKGKTALTALRAKPQIQQIKLMLQGAVISWKSYILMCVVHFQLKQYVEIHILFSL